MQVYAEENGISILKIKQHFRFLCLLILTCEKKPVLGIYLSELSFHYPSNKIIKIRKELHKKMTDIISFAEEPWYPNCSTQIPRCLKHFSVSPDFDLLYLWKYRLMTQTPL